MDRLIIEIIKERIDTGAYDRTELYTICTKGLPSAEESRVARALTYGDENDVKDELKAYIDNFGYDPEFKAYIDSVNWK